MPAAITEAFVRACRIERVHFPGARHGFVQQAGADTDRAIALMRAFIARQL